jgi:hypothetical protein
MRSPESNDMMFRRVRESDYPALLELQEANLRDNLSEVERSQGFLSARFSREQFAAMDQDVAVIVATLDGVIAGYLCGSSVEFNSALRAARGDDRALPTRHADGRPLASYASFVYGPACVDRQFRGRGVCAGCIAPFCGKLPSNTQSALPLWRKTTRIRSQRTCRVWAMLDVGSFDFDARRYRILAFATDETGR